MEILALLILIVLSYSLIMLEIRRYPKSSSPKQTWFLVANGVCPTCKEYAYSWALYSDGIHVSCPKCGDITKEMIG